MKNILFIVMSFLLLSSLIIAQEDNQSLGKTLKKDTPDKSGVIQGSVKVPNQTTTVVSYDFTTGDGSQFHGGEAAAVEVAPGVWAMAAGETNNSGVITNADKDLIDANIDVTGYLTGDTNLSGVVTNADKDFIDSNIDKASQVSN